MTPLWLKMLIAACLPAVFIYGLLGLCLLIVIFHPRARKRSRLT